MNSTGFFIYSIAKHQFVMDDEQSWTADLDEAACFTTRELARQIAVDRFTCNVLRIVIVEAWGLA